MKCETKFCTQLAFHYDEELKEYLCDKCMKRVNVARNKGYLQAIWHTVKNTDYRD